MSPGHLKDIAIFVTVVVSEVFLNFLTAKDIFDPNIVNLIQFPEQICLFLPHEFVRGMSLCDPYPRCVGSQWTEPMAHVALGILTPVPTY